MYYLISAITGMLIAAMVTFNGGLSAHYGVYSATVYIHVSGFLLISAIMLLRREKFFHKSIPFYVYLGGVVGFATTASNSLAFGKISVSAILALCLFAQSISSIVIDKFGFFGMPRCAFRKAKLFGLLLVLAGIGVMVLPFEAASIAPILLSLLSGVTIVVSRSINAMLAERTSHWASTWYNYVGGLIVSLIVMLFAGRQEPFFTGVAVSKDILNYLGGLVGVAVVFLTNVAVRKISALSMTLLLFVGQVGTGLGIDVLLSGEFSMPNFLGALFVAAGFFLNQWVDARGCKGDGKAGETY